MERWLGLISVAGRKDSWYVLWVGKRKGGGGEREGETKVAIPSCKL